jgi:hypothetical protein
VAATADYLASATLGPEEHLFLSDLIGRRKGREVELGPSFGRFLTAKIEFSYEAVQTVNLLALRLQWFESTPAQTLWGSHFKAARADPQASSK